MGLIALLLLASEIWLLVQVGAATSAVLVVGGVLLAFFVGLSVMRRGARRVAELGLEGQSRVSTVMTPFGLFVTRHEQRPNHGALLDAMGLVLAGFLLVLPGFVSDVAGLLLLVPPVRRAFIRRTLSLRGQPQPKPPRPEPRHGQADVEVLPPGSLPRNPLQKRPVVIDVE